MIAPVLIDSDVLIEVLRDRSPEIARRWEALASGDSLAAYSPVSGAEIWHGTRPSEARAISALFTALTCIPIDDAIGRRAGECLAGYRASHGADLSDALIAATASIHGVSLWTRNRKHFPMRDIRYF